MKKTIACYALVVARNFRPTAGPWNWSEGDGAAHDMTASIGTSLSGCGMVALFRRIRAAWRHIRCGVDSVKSSHTRGIASISADLRRALGVYGDFSI